MGVKISKATVEEPFHPSHEPTAVTYKQRAAEGGLCKCGMARANTPHLCIRWHPAMMNGAAPQELSEVVRKYVRTGDLQPLVTVDMQSDDTITFIRNLIHDSRVPPHTRAVLADMDFLEAMVLRDSEGNRLEIKWGEADRFGIHSPTITVKEDPAWVRHIVESNTVQRSTSAMPACCDRPDPRIGKSGRPFCANCKRYLDKTPKPVEAPVVETKR